LISAIIGDDFQLQVTLGEMPTTLKYIAEKLKPIIKSLRAFRKGDVYRGLKALGITRVKGKRIKVQKAFKAPASYWLEYRYAIRPMMNDISNALDRFNKEQSKDVTKRIRRGSKAEIPCAPYGESGFNTAKRKYWLDEKCTEYSSASVTIVAGFDYEAVDFRNIAGVVWELIPFSFVADWFAGIGNWLRARHFFSNALYSRGSVTDYLKYDTGKITRKFPSFPPCGPDFNNISESFNRRTIVRRRSLNPSYIPSIGFKHPITGTQDWARVIDGITLLEQLATGSSKSYTR
jgi:hypothetical protein